MNARANHKRLMNALLLLALVACYFVAALADAGGGDGATAAAGHPLRHAADYNEAERGDADGRGV
ncbi:MAG: hypothetical protein ACE5G3_03440 [Gammaproteobacteria bacterium]